MEKSLGQYIDERVEELGEVEEELLLEIALKVTREFIRSK